MWPHTAVYVASCCCMCVLMLLHLCPNTAVYVSSYCCICFLILLYMCPHTAVYVSSYCCICVLMLLYMCVVSRFVVCTRARFVAVNATCACSSPILASRATSTNSIGVIDVMITVGRRVLQDKDIAARGHKYSSMRTYI